jgi:hypothetical protein
MRKKPRKQAFQDGVLDMAKKSIVLKMKRIITTKKSRYSNRALANDKTNRKLENADDNSAVSLLKVYKSIEKPIDLC